MKNLGKIAIVVAVILVITLIAIFVIFSSKTDTKTNLPTINNAEDLKLLVDKLYEGRQDEMPMLMSQEIDVSDAETLQMATGLQNGEKLEYVVTSEPMMTSQAYSLVLAKVKDGVNANEIAKEMNENINTRKWICVSAEKVYTTSSANIVCLVMSSEELAKPVYEEFKKLAGNISEEYVRIEAEVELPEDMY